MIGVLLAMAVGAPTAQADGAVRYADISLGMKKSDLAALVSRDGLTLDCSAVTKAEVPTSGVETCRVADAAFLLAQRQGDDARLIAYSVSAPKSLGSQLKAATTNRFGAPVRVLDTRWGQSSVWQQAGGQVSFREACTAGKACLEVSSDAFSRRVARSTGLFVPATPGT